MSACETAQNPRCGTGGPHELHDRLAALHAHAATLTPGDALEGLLSKVSGAADQLTVEHAGMAEELLCAYEQLGTVFEVTRRLSNVRNESEVVDLFIDSLRRSYEHRDVFTIHARLLDHTGSGDVADPSTGWLEALIRRARDQQSVMVESPPAGAVPGGVCEVMVGPVFAGDTFACAIVLMRPDEVEPFRSGDMLLLESLTMFCGDLIGNHRLVHQLQEMSLAVVRSLVNAVDQKDRYTSGHSVRVGYFATLLGQALGLTDSDLQMLQWGALLHDVGKIGTRDDVLNKAGTLTDEEFDHIKEHPASSYKIVQDIPQLARAFDAVLHHHEHYDGTGYPAGLVGEKIPLHARVIQIADVFDALTSDRAYRPAFDWRKALDILKREAGRTVDPNLQEIFDRVMRAALDADPEGWETMVQTANEFSQVTQELSTVRHGN